MAKKKRKKSTTRPGYAKGKKPEEKPKAQAKGVQPVEKVGGEKGKREVKGGWNLIRSGTLEMKVFQGILAILIFSTLLQYPLLGAATEKEYKKAKSDYRNELEEWKEKYKTSTEQKKHKSSKPKEPVKPTGGIIIFELAIGVLWVLLISFLALNISRRTDLRTPILDRASSGEKPVGVGELLTYSIPLGLISSIPLVAGSYISAHLADVKHVFADYPLWSYSLYFINTGVIYSILFVFLGVSCFTWLASRFVEKIKLDPHHTGIAGASVFALLVNIPGMLKGAGTNSSTGETIALSPLVMVWVALLGYIYWKKGLEYSILAGAIGFALYPFFTGLLLK
ncbi:MAG: hypothetical protein PHP64_03695 [Actinomycetota bacterium]|nr:hypothetical protein [Actinomycetota bacterium]